MKKRITTICLLLTFCISTVYSQWKVTPEAGVSILKEKDGGKAQVSPRIGVGASYWFNRQSDGFGVTSGIYFYQKRSVYSVGMISATNKNGEMVTHPFYDIVGSPDGKGEMTGITFYDFDTRRNYLQLPILATYRWKLTDIYAISLAAGPYVAVGISGKNHVGTYSYVKEEDKTHYSENSSSSYDLYRYSRFDMGFSSRLSLSAGNLVVNLDYETNLYRRNRGKENLISLGIGYEF